MQLGTDIIEIQRIKSAMEKHPRFCRRILTPKEQEYASSLRDKSSFVAGRFAAKEATVKCLGLGLRGFSWQDMEILPDELGKPLLSLSPRLSELGKKQGIEKLEVSISHCREYALAVVIGE
ncbi:MAG: holo-ACP synthase [Peptococcia bacterium]